MTRAIEKVRWWHAALLVVCIPAGCGTPSSTRVVTGRQASGKFSGIGGVVRADGLWSNGLWSNGLTTNGLWSNGLWSNGLWSNGLWSNGLWSNGLWSNGLWSNGLWSNGLWSNGLWSNGLWSNGLWSNGLWSNGLAPNSGVAEVGSPAAVLQSSAYSRQLLEYVYGCAMPAAAPSPDGGAPLSYDTMLDPNNGTLACGPDGSCDTGYACSANNTCVVPLTGTVGLAINDDGSTWWGPPAARTKSGTCDESCQRWVSACVLARTNAYGVHVEISMRAPDDAPQAIKDALAVSDVERNGDETHRAYSLREGAYYGNLFATTPGSLDSSGTFQPSTDGTTASVIVESPTFFACAGPGSNIPEITERFCSSQGDQVVIRVPGMCLANATEGGTCAGEDTDPTSATFGAIHDCFTSTDPTQQSVAGGYKEVITVYLQQPIAVCGNAVCDTGEDASSCPSDCHAGTWAKTFPNGFRKTSGVTLAAPLGGTWNASSGSMTLALSAVAPDDTVVMAGGAYNDLDLGGGTLAVSQGVGVVAKFLPDGQYAWGVRFGDTSPSASNGQLLDVDVMNVASSGNITVAGNAVEDVAGDQFGAVGIRTYSADGVPVASWSLGPIRSNGAGSPDSTPSTFSPQYIAVDSQGNVIVEVLAFKVTATFGSTSLASPADGSAVETFLVKMSPQGTVLWAKSFNGTPVGLAIDPVDDIALFAAATVKAPNGAPTTLMKLSPDGSVLWSRDGGLSAWYSYAALDATGSLYATGMFTAGQDFGGGAVTYWLRRIVPFLVKYGPDGAFQWVNYAGTPNALMPRPVAATRGRTRIPTRTLQRTPSARPSASIPPAIPCSRATGVRQSEEAASISGSAPFPRTPRWTSFSPRIRPIPVSSGSGQARSCGRPLAAPSAMAAQEWPSTARVASS